MTRIRLCSCGFAADDETWFSGHLFDHPGHHERDSTPVPGDRPHDVSAMSTPALERARSDLLVSLSLAFPGSPVRGPILAHLSAIDLELERRNGWDFTKLVPRPPLEG
jgi:hypothetical protein